ncbi:MULTISPECIES: ABC-three component system middle component 1 [Pseudomonas]|uniref:ABC-three component system middle component 1 n=1 Tax=Pseudomonas TaxID=286 RepID=UPI001BE9BC17|nr:MULTISPECIES: ABC-three component system middle component 1 [Pseudomonas]MBT2342257.1 hypothetical protein [Pseudomonas fluorescens]MCD4532301.1 hypothetical protein [Pseudomonas sp. C3-2018]
MANLLSADLELSVLQEEFPDFQFAAYTSSDHSLICFACHTPTAQAIVDNWRQMQSVIAGIFQTTNPRAKWNFYLAFFCLEKVQTRQNYEIQNDKFCCRKMIFDSYKYFFDREKILEDLSCELLGKNLKLVERSTPKEYTCEILTFIRDTPISHNYNDKIRRQEIIKQLMDRITE